MVYEIVKYNLIGKELFTCKERPDLEARYDERNIRERFYEKGTNYEAPQSHLWEYSTKPKQGAFSPDERFLPYFADVTEDLPGSVRYLKNGDEMEPKTYKNCQLLTQKHGGYLEFWHEPTQETLRIALNSNTYEPVK